MYFNFIPRDSPTLTDFYAQVTINSPEANIESELAYGITFRHIKDDYGFFGIVKSGTFRILEVTPIPAFMNGLKRALMPLTKPPDIQIVSLSLSIGNDFVFFINDVQVAQMSEDLGAGQFGLGVDALKSESQDRIEFSDFQVDTPK